jgi:hypothetical protein
VESTHRRNMTCGRGGPGSPEVAYGNAFAPLRERFVPAGPSREGSAIAARGLGVAPGGEGGHHLSRFGGHPNRLTHRGGRRLTLRAVQRVGRGEHVTCSDGEVCRRTVVVDHGEQASLFGITQ